MSEPENLSKMGMNKCDIHKRICIYTFRQAFCQTEIGIDMFRFDCKYCQSVNVKCKCIRKEKANLRTVYVTRCTKI